MKIAVVKNGYPVGKAHMVSVLKKAGHDVVFIDIEAMPIQGQDFDAVFVDEADSHILNSVHLPDVEDLICFEYHPPVGAYNVSQNRLRSLDSNRKVHPERKPRPYYRKERW